MPKFSFLIFLIIFINQANADNKQKIISNFQTINNLIFDFEQNINGKIENGSCIVEYPKRIFCKYNSQNNKILVSNGKSIVIKTDSGSYYRYQLEDTPLNLILDKEYLLKEIKELKEKIIKDELLSYSINKDELKINIFFDKNNLNLVGWQTLDIYQNLSVTQLFNIAINQKIDTKKFKLPSPN